jgi:hypothetical protein
MATCSVLFCPLCLMLIGLARSTAAAAPLNSPYTVAHLHPSLAHIIDDDTHASSSFHVVIRLNEPPLLSLSLPLRTPRAAAREAVAKHLQQHRHNVQSDIRALLAASSCEFFWITNRISCRTTSLWTLRALAQRSDVAAIHPPSAMRRPAPVNSRTPLSHTPPSTASVQPNIHQVFHKPLVPPSNKSHSL